MYKVKVILGWENIVSPRETEQRKSPGEPQHGNDDSSETNESKMVLNGYSRFLMLNKIKEHFVFFLFLLAYKLGKSEFSGHSCWEHL